VDDRPPVNERCADLLSPSADPASHDEALATTHEWFDRHSGWAPPDEGTMAEWLADGVCRCPDECLVAPDGCCEHGLASWAIILAALAEEDRMAARHRAAFERG
jgi:hypothetical protein